MGNGAHNHEHEHTHSDESHPFWKTEKIELRSIGIDIGSTTSHLMISEIMLQRQGIALSSKFHIVNKKVIYESRILLTPFLHGNTIDAVALSKFITSAYKVAKVTPENIDTGAVVLTGEAAKKGNAEAIARLFAAESGKFVCATAGPNLEARMASYGSGAVTKSLVGKEGSTIMNIDIGGGTSKIAIVHRGTIIDTSTVNVGARLIALSDSGKVLRVEDPAQVIASELGINLKLGLNLGAEEKAQIVKSLADSLLEVIQRRSLTTLTQKLMMTLPLSFTGKIDSIIFSGGVSEYIYGFENRDYGDLGDLLSKEIIRRVSSPEFGITIEAPLQRIRATVIGASQYTVQVSGSTIFISDDNILPLRNFQVVSPHIECKEITDDYIEKIIHEAFHKNDLSFDDHPIALAFHWPLDPSHESIYSLAKGIALALVTGINKSTPVVLVFDADIGSLVGNMLKNELGLKCALVSIDSIELQEFDFIDIGKRISDSDVVPVVIKSLVFRPGLPC